MISKFFRKLDTLPEGKLRRLQRLMGSLLALDGLAILVSASCLILYAILQFLGHGMWWAEDAKIKNTLDTPVAVMVVLTWDGGSKDFCIPRRLDPGESMTVRYDSDDQRPTELLIKRSDGEIYLAPYRSYEYPERMIISEETYSKQAPADMKARFVAREGLEYVYWVGRGLLLLAALPFIAFPPLACSYLRCRGEARRRSERGEPAGPA